MKITDIEPYSGYGDPVYHRYLEFVGANPANKSGKSDKYWEVAVFRVDGKFLIVRRWGKYGKRGTIPDPEIVYGRYTAKRKARSLKAKKRTRGYTKEIDVITRLGMQFGKEDVA